MPKPLAVGLPEGLQPLEDVEAGAHRLGVDVQRRVAPGPDRAAGVEPGRGLQGVRRRIGMGGQLVYSSYIGRGAAAAESSYTPGLGISKVRRAAARRVLASRRAW